MPVNLLGVTLPLLAMTLSIDNLCNGFTRPLCGFISDKIGRENNPQTRSGNRAAAFRPHHAPGRADRYRPHASGAHRAARRGTRSDAVPGSREPAGHRHAGEQRRADGERAAADATLRAQLPDTTIVVLDRPQRAAMQLVRSGEAELGVVIAPDNLDELAAELLFDDGLAAIVAASHGLFGLVRIEWPQLRGQPLLLDNDTGSLVVIEAALAQPSAVVRMAEANLGIGILPVHARAACPGVRFIPLAPEAARAVMLIRRRSRAFCASAASVWVLLSAASSSTLIPKQTVEA